MDENSLKNMGQVFVRARVRSQIHGAVYSYRGRIPSQEDGASICTVDEYPVRNVRQVFVLGRITSHDACRPPCLCEEAPNIREHAHTE